MVYQAPGSAVCRARRRAVVWIQPGGGATATVRAPRELGVTQPHRPCVCVWSIALLSPACTDATLFLFQIFTADFLFTLASVPASSVVFLALLFFSGQIR